MAKAAYVRMVARMPKRCKKNEPAWHLYMLECADGTFYTGVTNRLEFRLAAHQSGRGARYTRTRLPVRMVYSERCGSRGKALSREIAVKRLSRTKKEHLVRRFFS